MSTTVIGCDIGVSNRDRNTGLVVARCTDDGVVTILDDPTTTTRTSALQLLPRLIAEHRPDYVVLDAPLLPGDRRRPSAACFRPHENMVRQPRGPAQQRMGFRDSGGMTAVFSTIQVMSCWTASGPLSDFAAAGNEALDRIAPLGYPLIDRYDRVEPRGTLEGFPKAFYLPFLTESPEVLAAASAGRGKTDEAFLSILLDTAHGAFWERTGLTPAKGPGWSIAFRDPDIICGLAMALSGILYGRGQAGVLWSRLGDFRFGHILTPALRVSAPWVSVWREDRLAAQRASGLHAGSTAAIEDIVG